MDQIRVLAVLAVVAVTSSLLVLLTSTADSIAQNDTTTLGNQSGTAVNDTAMENATGSGSISSINRAY